jgi:MoaA/NifB/PqqE/SkfB family radical SAM enzyme
MLRAFALMVDGEWSMNKVAGESSSIPSDTRAPEATISLGLGLTNECNLTCSFCYRDPTRTDRLSLDQLKSVMERLPIRSVNLGTGENGMHPDFQAILEYLRKKPVELTITSNGHSVAVLEDNELRAFHDIEFSLAENGNESSLGKAGICGHAQCGK